LERERPPTVGARMTADEKEFRTDLDVISVGGQEAITLFLNKSRQLHEAGNSQGLHEWIAIAAPALPRKDLSEVMKLMMYGFLYMDYQLQPRTEREMGTVH